MNSKVFRIMLYSIIGLALVVSVLSVGIVATVGSEDLLGKYEVSNELSEPGKFVVLGETKSGIYGTMVTAVTPSTDELLKKYEIGDKQFERVEIGDKIVYWHQRMIDDAIVEGDYIIYKFNKNTKELVDKTSRRCTGLPEHITTLITNEEAESMVDGEVQFTKLYIISPESDVFPLTPAPESPCWVVRSIDDGDIIVTIIDATNGKILGYGVPPPHTGFSFSGPDKKILWWWKHWDPWYKNAETWFNTMGYSTEACVDPNEEKVKSHIQSTETAMFYEIAHGGSSNFKNSPSDFTHGFEIRDWMADYKKMPFTFIASCKGMCNVGEYSLSYEFRKGSVEDTATVGYCDMDEPRCDDAWGESVDWQETLFNYMSQGDTVKEAFDKAMTDYPMCVGCMQFAGDEDFVVVPVVERETHFSITVNPEKNGYEPGENAKVTVDVTNNRDSENIWLGVSFKDSTGESAKYNPQITITPESANIDSGETETFNAEWTIPNDAPLGEYEIAVNCWEDDTFTNRYTDDLEWGPIFYVFNIDIISPTTSSPVIVGDPSTPAEFNAEVSTGIPFILAFPGAFNAMIGSKPAVVTVIPSFFDNAFGYYTLQITPTTQDTDGSYDLNIGFSLDEVSDYDVELDAVIYSTGGNIDVVEVIDRSGSMRGEPIQAAKDSAKLFVDRMVIDDSIGVASYSSGASVNYGLTKITSDTTKQNAKTAIDGISAGGMTSIGAGLRAAYNELVNKGDPSHPHSIVLMSDGWHNTAPHPDTVLPDIRNANIRVFTIGLGAGADASLLSHIAHDSGGGGGEYYYSPGSGELSAIYNAIAGVAKAESTVKTVTGSIQQDETITHNVDIDPTIDIVTFTVTWASGTVNLELERPDGSTVDPSDPDVISHTKEATYETYTIDNPLVGKWTMEITATSSSSSSTETTAVTLINAGETVSNSANKTIDDNWSTETDVLSKMPAKIESTQNLAVAQAGIPYTATVTATTNLTVHIYLDKDEYSLNEPMKIITALTKAGSPVTGADVNVTIERPDAAKDYLSLYDDGKHDDGVALDGVYANYYTNTDVAGSYTITVYASGTTSPEEFTREVKKSVYVSGAPAGEISVTPSSWDVKTFKGVPTEYAVSEFTTNSASTKDETVLISATDLTDAYGNIGIEVDSINNMPSTFQIPAKGSGVFYTKMDIPEDTNPGKYTGSLVLTSTANSVSIPVSLDIIVPTGGFSVAILPKIKPANAAEACDFTVRVRNTQNFDEDVVLDLTLTGIPAQHVANLAWFNWTTSSLSIPAGEYRDIGLRMDIPDGISGYKSFGIVAHGTFGDSKDYGVVNVISAP